MPADSESYGHPHTMVVYFDGDELTYDLEHALTCQQEERYEGRVLEYTCDIAWHEIQCGLWDALDGSIKEPGTYRIQAWASKTYYHGHGYEHDTGVTVISDEKRGDSDAA